MFTRDVNRLIPMKIVHLSKMNDYSVIGNCVCDGDANLIQKFYLSGVGEAEEEEEEKKVDVQCRLPRSLLPSNGMVDGNTVRWL